MATVFDYTSGKILNDVKSALFYLKFVKQPIIGRYIEKKLQHKINEFEPKIITLTEASTFIHNSSQCAVGPRICMSIHKNSEFSESVFLDELAEELVHAEQAAWIDKTDAIDVLRRYKNRPLIISKVSGKYMEICCSFPQNCVYWCAEKKGLRCVQN